MSRSTQALLCKLPELAQAPLLDIGSDHAAVASYAAERWGEAVYLHPDLTACERAKQEGRLRVLHADVLPEERFSTVVIDSTEFDGAYAMELTLSSVKTLTAAGVLIIALPTQHSQLKWQEALESVFRQVDVEPDVAIARLPYGEPPLPAEHEYNVTWDQRSFRFHSGAGVFSPRAFDQGTQAMLELVPKPDTSAMVLDLGCGTGVVSVLAAACWGCQVLAADTNARALRFTRENVAANHVAELVEIQASDGFSHIEEREFDLILTNPPYHTDYAIAKAFIEGAAQHLRVGGSFWVVVKKPDWYQAKMRSVFGGCRLFERGGYSVLMAERRTPVPSKAQPLAQNQNGTKKHQKRLAETVARKRRKGKH